MIFRGGYQGAPARINRTSIRHAYERTRISRAPYLGLRLALAYELEATVEDRIRRFFPRTHDASF